MFDIGFAELIIIGVVALIVIGPERLPEAVRTASAWLGRIRRGFNEIKQEVQQELHNDAVLRDLRESGEQLKRETEALRRDLSDAEHPAPSESSAVSKPTGPVMTEAVSETASLETDEIASATSEPVSETAPSDVPASPENRSGDEARRD